MKTSRSYMVKRDVSGITGAALASPHGDICHLADVSARERTYGPCHRSQLLR
jgi:hypothetical protein